MRAMEMGRERVGGGSRSINLFNAARVCVRARARVCVRACVCDCVFVHSTAQHTSFFCYCSFLQNAARLYRLTMNDGQLV